MSDCDSINGCDSEGVLAFENSGIHKISLVSHACSQSIESLGRTFSECLGSHKIVIPPEYNHATRAQTYKRLFFDGIPCEKLEPNSPGWQKGKLKLTLKFDFIPDPVETDKTEEPEECVDETLDLDLDKFRQ